MSTNKSFDALIVDTNPRSRARLKDAAMAETVFGKISIESNLDGALARLNESTPCDIVFVNESFAKEDISKFVELAKKTKQGEDCAYILVIKAESAENRVIAESMLGGAHGVLYEPYSVDGLQEVARIASQVKKQNAIKRKKVAVKLLLENLSKEIDKISSFKARGLDVSRAMEKFARQCKALASFSDEESIAIYAEVAEEVFGNAKPAEFLYMGASSRVKKKMEEKLQREYEAEYGSSD